jgi:hypothetical protein
MARNRLIVVLGMHRAGTSLTTNLLNRFGVPLSDDLIEPAFDNAAGFFESKRITKIHDDILAVLGLRWSTSGLITALPDQWWRLPQIRPLKEQLASIAAAEIERNDGLWGFKEPRTARILPVWNEIIEELDLDARFLLVSRHPAEVAESLYKRDRIDAFQSESLWLVHYADAVRYRNGRIDAMVDYRGWMDDPLAQAAYVISALGLSWQGTAQETERIVQDTVSPDLRHNAAARSAFALPFTQPFYDALLRRDLPALQALAETFEQSRSFMRAVLADATHEVRAEIERLLYKPANGFERAFGQLTGLRRIITVGSQQRRA